MSIIIRKAITEDLAYLKKFKLEFNENSYIINLNGERVGVLEYTIYEDSLHLAYISVESKYRRQGIGRRVIGLLMEEYGDILGDCSPNQISIDFWSKLGAEFEEDIEDYNLYNYCIPFVVYS